MQAAKVFQLFVQDVLIDQLTNEKLQLFGIHLEAPRRTLEEAESDRTKLLLYLKDQMLIEKWQKKPALLEDILSSVLKRQDLVNKLRELVDKHTSQSALPTSHSTKTVPIQESANTDCSSCPIQETHNDQSSSTLSESSAKLEHSEQDSCSAVQADAPLPSRHTQAVHKRPRRRRNINRERRHGGVFETVPEEGLVQDDDEGFQDNMVPSVNVENKLPSPSSPEKKDFYEFFKSDKIQQDYGKKTVTGVLSDFNKHLDSSRTPTTSTQTLPLPTQQNARNQSHTSLSRTPSNVSKTSERSSGYFSSRSSDARLSQLSLESLTEYMDDEIEEIDSSSPSPNQPDSVASHDLSYDPCTDIEFRSRSSSLPSNSQKHARPIVSHGIGQRLTSSSSSSTSLASDDSESTTSSSSGSESQYNSQSSLFDHASFTNDGAASNAVGSLKGKLKSNVRLHPLSEVMGKMELSSKDIRRDISKQKSREHKSSPFTSGELQYEMKFYPLAFDPSWAALYIDVAMETSKGSTFLVNEDDEKQHKCTFEVPQMNIKASIYSRDLGCHGDSVCVVSKEMEVGGVMRNNRIAAFPKLVSVEELKSIKKGRIIAIEVVLKLV